MQSKFVKKETCVFICCLLVFMPVILESTVSGQQMRLNSGTYLNYSGASIVVNGKINNEGSITNKGTSGFRLSGELLNSGTFVAGTANHKIGGNFNNNGIFSGTGSNITCNGSSPQSIDGTSATTFNDLTIDNAAGVMLASNVLTTVSGALTITGGAKFEIGPGKRLTVDGPFNNNGILNLNSDATGIFSLMMSSYSGTGTANITMYLTGAGGPEYKWHYVAVPTNLNDKTVFTSINSKNLLRYDDSGVPNGIDYTIFEGWVWNDGYRPGDTEGGPYTGTGFSTLEAGRGYNFYHSSPSAVATFSNLSSLQASLGPLSLQYNGGGKTVPANYGFNLVGNSLTCGIDWDKVTEAGGNPDNAVYFTINSRVGTYMRGVPGSGINGATNHMPPLQGFFVKTNATGTSLDFSAAKEHTSQQRYKGENVTTIPLIKLELNNSGNQDETLVWFNEKATSIFDGDYDASKLFSSEAGYDQIYTWIGSERYGINGIPLPERTIIIPVAVKLLHSGSGNQIIATQLQGLDDYHVTLTDKGNTNLTVDLKNTDRYTFSSEAGTFADRFFLTITNVFAGIPDIIVSEKVFNIFSFDKTLNIELVSNKWEGRGCIISIYDPEGRKILQQNNVKWYTGELKQIPLDVLPGIYIVEINSAEEKFVSKIILF
jgi:hypothetical protein